MFAHPDASLAVEWVQGSDKAVAIADPKAGVKAQEGKFKGSLARFGHGLQRSFLLAILQELALSEEEEASATSQPTLILAGEKPELYQHPPQARHLANVLRSLTETGNQVLLTTHSAYFVSGGKNGWIEFVNKARQAFEPGASLRKSPLLIAEVLWLAWDAGQKPFVLSGLSSRLLAFAGDYREP